MDAFLEFSGITRRFGDVHAVDCVTLGIKKGELFGLLGPSGCGKTTLLRIAAGFDQPDAGTVLLEGRDITRLAPNKRPVNTVFQSYALFPHMTVWENIAFGLRVAGRPKREVAREVDRMLSLIQMDTHAQKRPTEISGGQRQRVAIARALINRPRVLLLDEPLAALDLKLRQIMLIELAKIHQEVGTTFVFVTHDQGEAMSLCDRIAVMKCGKVEQIGTPREIYSAPATSFVASFIGDTNFLNAKVIQRLPENRTTLTAPGLPDFNMTTEVAMNEGDEILLGIRPERIRLSAQHPEPSNEVITCECTVDEIIFMGSSSRYGLRVGDQRIWAVRMHDQEHDQLTLRHSTDAWLSFHSIDLQIVKREQQDLEQLVLKR